MSFTLSTPLQDAFDYYDTSALCPACWHSRTPLGSKRCQSSLSVPSEVIAILSCLLYAARTLRRVQIPVGRSQASLPFWSECVSQFHSSKVTTLQTKVSLVSIDHRVSPSFPSDWVGRTIVSGLHTPGNAVSDACRVTLAHSQCCSPSNSRRLAGAPNRPPRTLRAASHRTPLSTVSPFRHFTQRSRPCCLSLSAPSRTWLPSSLLPTRPPLSHPLLSPFPILKPFCSTIASR